MGVEEGKALLRPIIEFSYKCDELNDPFINDDYALALGLATEEEIKTIKTYTAKVNEVLKEFFLKIGIRLIDFKIEFGRLADGTIILADEISEEIWAVQKKHIRKLCTEFLENKIIWADFLVQFPQTTAFQTYFLEQIIIHTLVQDGAV